LGAVHTEVGDFTRFSNPRHLRAYFGLAPGERSSGADSDEAGHAFQKEAGHLFRSEAGRRSDLMSATGAAPQVDLDDVLRLGRGQARSGFTGEDWRLRRLSPQSSIR
ncbi:MAG: transposase, partial [Hyphomicrobiales bacterium]